MVKVADKAGDIAAESKGLMILLLITNKIYSEENKV